MKMVNDFFCFQRNRPAIFKASLSSRSNTRTRELKILLHRVFLKKSSWPMYTYICTECSCFCFCFRLSRVCASGVPRRTVERRKSCCCLFTYLPVTILQTLNEIWVSKSIHGESRSSFRSLAGNSFQNARFYKNVSVNYCR